jgi:hypothetical protein
MDWNDFLMVNEGDESEIEGGIIPGVLDLQGLFTKKRPQCG